MDALRKQQVQYYCHVDVIVSHKRKEGHE